MIEQIDKCGINIELTDDFKRYAQKKIGRLSRYIPRHARRSVHAELKIREVNQDHGNKYEAEVILHLPHEQITVKEATLNMFAAVDILEEKLKNRLKKYKEQNTDHRGRHGILGRMKRQVSMQPEPVLVQEPSLD